MKYINNNSIKTLLLMLVMVFVISACEDEDKAPIVTFDTAGKGAYVKFISDNSASDGLLINLLTQADYDASQYIYSVEFYDGSNGDRVNQYILNVEYDPASGSSQGPAELRSYSISDFASSENGILGIGNITITAADVATTFGLSYADLTAGDEFKITGSLVTTDNGTFSGDNSQSTISGDAFQGYFDYNMGAGCPNTIVDTFSYVTDLSGWDSGTNSGSTSGSVDIFLNSAGYQFSDWSFGGYQAEYGCCVPGGSFSFTEVCGVVTMFEAPVDSYGDQWMISTSIVGDTWIVNWINTGYAGGLEQGVTTITFPGGVPFTLAP
jgi:hypothetical protein